MAQGKQAVVITAILGFLVCFLWSYMQSLKQPPVPHDAKLLPPNRSISVGKIKKFKKGQSWQEEFTRRKKRVIDLCAKLNISDAGFGSAPFFTVDERKLLMCVVPKTGSSTIRRTFQTMLNLSLAIKWELSEAEYYEKYTDYTTIIFIRHPLDRLVSAYRNKILKRIGKFKGISEQMKDLYRKDQSPAAMEPKVTFREFIQYFLDYPRDEHWETYIKLCNPCKMHYDIILRHETFEMDFATIITMNSNFTLAEAKALILNRNRSGGKTSTQLADDYKGDIPKPVRDQVYQILKDDFDLFEYDYNW